NSVLRRPRSTLMKRPLMRLSAATRFRNASTTAVIAGSPPSRSYSRVPLDAAAAGSPGPSGDATGLASAAFVAGLAPCSGPPQAPSDSPATSTRTSDFRIKAISSDKLSAVGGEGDGQRATFQ